MADVPESFLRWTEWVLASAQPAVPSAPASNVFRSADADETRRAIAQVFIEHELEVLSRGFEATLAEWDLGHVVVAYVKEGAEVTIRTGRYGSWYGVDIPVKGAETARAGGTEGEYAAGRVFVQPATEEIEMRRSADWEEVALRIDRTALELELSRILRRDIDAPVLFEPAMVLSSSLASSWAISLSFVLDEIREDTRSLEHPLVRSRLEQLLIDQLLLAQPHNYSHALETGHHPARSPTVRRAMEIIKEHAADPLTIPRVAEVVGVSVRSLQQGFRDYLSISPLEYQREIRLIRAREDLLAAAERDEGTTVTEIAYRWGFGHLARFAGYYKHRFGELPSDTLYCHRRARVVDRLVVNTS